MTLGSIVATVMLAIWGATALAGAIHPDLKPAPAIKSITARPATATATTVATAATVATVAAKPAPKPAPAPKPKAVAPVKPKAQPKPAAKYVVVVDPGHGGELPGDEPSGPNDPTPHPRTAFGATSASGFTEAEGVLAIALKLRPLLEADGVKVIMVRTGPRAISNKDRAAIANNAHADLFLRLHMDGQDGGSSVHGISMQVPASTKGWAPIGPSRKAGEIILNQLIKDTGANDRGIDERTDLAGFNWCKVPTALPELGFLSNPTEARKLASDSYQQTLAESLAKGTMSYLRTVR